MFALQRLRSLAGGHPEWQTQLPYAAALELGSKYLQEATDEDVFQLVATAHAGRTQDAFRQDVRDYFATARHPRFDRPWTQLTYGPMRELITHLKANGFRVFISTTGSIDLVRVLAEDLYGIPADDVIGSSVVSTLREEDGRLVLRRLATVHGLNDGPLKPLTIDAARRTAARSSPSATSTRAATSTCSATASRPGARTCRCWSSTTTSSASTPTTNPMAPR